MIKAIKLDKTYKITSNNKVHALRDADFEVKTGEITALIGPSGSGKSTVLNILGGLDRDYDGRVEVDGLDIKQYNTNFFRRSIVQTIFQQFYLVPSLTVEENVLLPIKFGGQMSGRELKERTDMILEKVGLKDRRKHKPKELSGGQAQRVAIARALIPNPKIILADEPTGNLDSKTGDDILDLIRQINKEEKTTILLITHDLNLIKDVKNRVILKDGVVVNEKAAKG